MGNKGKISRWKKAVGAVLLLCVGAIWAVRRFPEAGEWYARKVYPSVADFLSLFSSWLPFSLGDCWVVLAAAGLLVYLAYAVHKRLGGVRVLVDVALFLGFIYVWFYLAWGLNYFRKDFYARTGIPYRQYEETVFREFLDDYVKELNDSYVAVERVDTARVMREVTAGYDRIAEQFGLIRPGKIRSAKPMLWSGLMSKTGVLGYMEPFFAEFCLNRELLPVQYPQTYAHELSHRLGVASEAEANLYAYLVCSASEVPEIRFSGYFSLFPYVMVNAARVLPEEDYKALMERVRPEIFESYKRKQAYWDARYSQWIGEAQYRFYNFFLKGNRISSGTANYSEVVGLLIAYRTKQGRAS